MRLQRKLIGDASGAAAVEFGLLLPMMVILFVGSIELARALWYHHAMNKGTRDAVRYLSRVPGGCPATDEAFFTDAGDWSKAQSLARTGSIDGTDPVIPILTASDADFAMAVDCVDNSGGEFAGGLSLPKLRMSLSAPFNDIVLQMLGIGPITFTVEHEEQHIGE